DYDHFPRIFRNVRQAKVIKELPGGVDVDFVVDARLRDIHYVLTSRYVEYGKRITWTRLSGDLQIIDGGWTIESGPNSGLLRVTYESYVKIGWYVPAFAARLSASNEVRVMVRALRDRLGELRAGAQLA